jgi:iron complex outermembrane receptor protein
MTSLKSFRTQTSVLTLCVAASLATAAYAQPEQSQPRRGATQVDEVTITAERREVNLQTAAISATVLDAEQLEAQNVVGLTSLQFAAPGLQISDYSSANTFNIRGIGQSQVDIDLPSGVVIYRDGVPTLTGYFQNAPYYDMAGVEVLRGPQGTFVGKSAAAGAVFIRTRDPVLGERLTGDITLGAGNHEFFEETLILNQPIGDTMAVRLSIHAEQRGSLFDSITSNPVPGSTNIYEQAWTGSDRRNLISGRLGVLWMPNERFRAVFKIDADYLFFGSHITSGINPVTGVEEDVSNPIANGINIYRDEGVRSSLNMRWNFGSGVALNSLTGFSTVNTRANWDSNGSNPLASGFVSAGTFTNYSQEFNLISPDEGRFRWVAGVFYQYYTNHIPGVEAQGFGIFNTLSGTLPLLATPWDKNETSYAIFGQGAFDITDRLELQVGARWSHYEFDQFTQFTLPVFGNIPFTEPAGGVRQDFEEDSIDWKVNLNYDISDTQFVYGLVSRGHSPGSINIFPNPITPAQHSSYGEMEVINYEAGWKGQFFDRRLRTQMDVYYQTFEGYQAAFAFPVQGIPDINNVTEFRAAQTTSKIWGVEIGAQAHFGDLEWNVGFAYNKSRLGNFGLIQNPFAGFFGQPATITLDGARTPFSPEVTFNAGVAYTFHLDNVAAGATLTPRIDVIYHSDSYANLYQNRATLLEGQTLLNAGVRFGNGPWWVQAWGTNLTDDRNPGAKQNVSGSTGQFLGSVYMAPPRLFGIRIGRSF